MPIAELAVESERRSWLQMMHCQGQLHPRAVGRPASTTAAHQLHQVLRLIVQGPATSKQLVLPDRTVITWKTKPSYQHRLCHPPLMAGSTSQLHRE